MNTAVTIIVAGAALACPLHMLWRTRQGQRARCWPARSDAGVAPRERQRELAAGIEALAPSEARRKAAARRH